MVRITLPRKLQTAGLFDYTTTPTINDVMKVRKEKMRQMRRYGYPIGALLGLLLPSLVIILIAARAEEMPRVVSVWPLLAALGTSVVTWWLQGLIYAVLARPQLKGLRVDDMFRIDMAGLFVALISPIRGAELPYKVYLLKRLGLSAGEGGNVVITRVLLDAVVLTPAALCGLVLISRFPDTPTPTFLSVSLAAAVVLAAAAFLVRRRGRRRSENREPCSGEPGWRARERAKISAFLRDIHRSFASYWRRGHRTTLVYAVGLTVVYWALRLCAGPLALMAVGWSGSWIPMVVSQLLLASFVLPLAPTPGGSGVRELGLVVLLSGYVPEGQLLSGLIVYTGLTHWLPLIASAYFAGHEFWREIFRRSKGRKAAGREGHTEAVTRILPSVAHTAPPQRCVSFGNQEAEEARTWQHDEASPPTDRIPGGSRA